MIDDGTQLNGSNEGVSAPQSRALVVTAPLDSVRVDERPLAAFVAQLIACHRRLPAFRKAGRERPAVARDSYTQAAVRPNAGRLVVVV